MSFHIDFSLLDLWWVPIIALGFQVYASIYLYRIHRRIGGHLTRLFTGFQVGGYIYIATILHRFVTNPPSIVDGGFDFARLFFGFAFPVADRLLHLWLMQYYEKGLEPNPTKEENMKRDTDRDAERDINRDSTRDVERDVTRDRDRDFRRDLYRDRRKDNNDNK